MKELELLTAQERRLWTNSRVNCLRSDGNNTIDYSDSRLIAVLDITRRLDYTAGRNSPWFWRFFVMPSNWEVV